MLGYHMHDVVLAFVGFGLGIPVGYVWAHWEEVRKKIGHHGGRQHT